ncbi:hypothetical protein K461DRAFT_308174 [Myriangium duriaei CBS 260.36]|uniref:Rhodopsin domain-containing protein n=1 Tax=Myriangium duriaei CBS 260.36 TaxID=1168546 RepID=A0A9P4IXB7_9PEZI|nr:hypothetical protein K461DRAFT_308174 [Myriangium duriaei CBS 260.36]
MFCIGIDIVGLVTFPKLSLLVIYNRIFIEQYQRITTFILMGILLAWTIGGSVAGALMCRPLEHFWNKDIPGHCVDIKALYSYSGIPNIFVDFVMLVLPVPTLWKLQASREVKTGLFITLATGSIGFVTAIIRTTVFLRHDPNVDITWVSSTLLIWTIIEPGCYVLASSLLCLRPLIKSSIGKLLLFYKNRRASLHTLVTPLGWSRKSFDMPSPEIKVPLVGQIDDVVAYPLSIYHGRNMNKHRTQYDDEQSMVISQHGL